MADKKYAYPDDFAAWFFEIGNYANPFSQIHMPPGTSKFFAVGRYGWNNIRWSQTWQDIFNLAEGVIDD